MKNNRTKEKKYWCPETSLVLSLQGDGRFILEPISGKMQRHMEKRIRHVVTAGNKRGYAKVSDYGAIHLDLLKIDEDNYVAVIPAVMIEEPHYRHRELIGKKTLPKEEQTFHVVKRNVKRLLRLQEFIEKNKSWKPRKTEPRFSDE